MKRFLVFLVCLGAALAALATIRTALKRPIPLSQNPLVIVVYKI